MEEFGNLLLANNAEEMKIGGEIQPSFTKMKMELVTNYSKVRKEWNIVEKFLNWKVKSSAFIRHLKQIEDYSIRSINWLDLDILDKLVHSKVEYLL